MVVYERLCMSGYMSGCVAVVVVVVAGVVLQSQVCISTSCRIWSTSGWVSLAVGVQVQMLMLMLNNVCVWSLRQFSCVHWRVAGLLSGSPFK